MEDQNKQPDDIVIGSQIQCPSCHSFKLWLLYVKTNTKDKTILTLLCDHCGLIMHQPLLPKEK